MTENHIHQVWRTCLTLSLSPSLFLSLFSLPFSSSFFIFLSSSLSLPSSRCACKGHPLFYLWTFPPVVAALSKSRFNPGRWSSVLVPGTAVSAVCSRDCRIRRSWYAASRRAPFECTRGVCENVHSRAEWTLVPRHRPAAAGAASSRAFSAAHRTPFPWVPFRYTCICLVF